jgi:hypothetical protein
MVLNLTTGSSSCIQQGDDDVLIQGLNVMALNKLGNASYQADRYIECNEQSDSLAWLSSSSIPVPENLLLPPFLEFISL